VPSRFRCQVVISPLKPVMVCLLLASPVESVCACRWVFYGDCIFRKHGRHGWISGRLLSRTGLTPGLPLRTRSFGHKVEPPELHNRRMKWPVNAFREEMELPVSGELRVSSQLVYNAFAERFTARVKAILAGDGFRGT
jgi:hypothetical protein